jgi:two-component system OmpR family response regulator
VLDVMLPDFGGLEVLRRLRAGPPTVCVLFLTAQESVEDRIAGITAPGLAVRQAPGRMFIRKKLRSRGNPYTTGATSAFLPRSRFRSSGWPDRHEC